MEVRSRVREAYANKLNIELRPVIYSKIESLKSSGVDFESNTHAFSLGYICGMENPSFEAVVEAVQVMKMFGELDNESQKIIMLIMDGMKARYLKELGEK